MIYAYDHIQYIYIYTSKYIYIYILLHMIYIHIYIYMDLIGLHGMVKKSWTKASLFGGVDQNPEVDAAGRSRRIRDEAELRGGNSAVTIGRGGL